MSAGRRRCPASPPSRSRRPGRRSGRRSTRAGIARRSLRHRCSRVRRCGPPPAYRCPWSWRRRPRPGRRSTGCGRRRSPAFPPPALFRRRISRRQRLGDIGAHRFARRQLRRRRAFGQRAVFPVHDEGHQRVDLIIAQGSAEALPPGGHALRVVGAGARHRPPGRNRPPHEVIHRPGITGGGQPRAVEERRRVEGRRQRRALPLRPVARATAALELEGPGFDGARAS